MNPIQSEVEIVLGPWVSPEYMSTLQEALSALHEHLYSEHELPVLNALGREIDDTIIAEVHAILERSLIDLCTLHQVKVDETTGELSALSKLVRALLLMQYWQEPETILAVCTSDASSVDKLANLVAIVGELSEMLAGDLIADVDPNFLRGLEKLYTSNGIAIEEQRFELPPPQLEQLRQYRSSMKAERTLAFRMVKAGYKPGYAFAEYMKRVAGTINQADNQAIAVEVVPFLLMGRDTWVNPVTGWRENNQLLNLDMNDMTGVDTAVMRLLAEFDLLKSKIKE